MGSQKTPAVSVIVPNYNHARFLRERIDSILAQTYQDFELILLDDCSTDESREILAQYASDPRVHLEFNQVNSGSTYKQWNKGVRLAQGQYVWIAESDDYADEKLLESLIETLEAHSEVAFVYCRSWCVDDEKPKVFVDSYLNDDSRLWEKDFVDLGPEAASRYFLLANAVGNASAVVFRKDVYERAGGADESFRYCADWKLWASMAMAGGLAYVCEPLNYYRYHATTVRAKSSNGMVSVIEPLRVVRWIAARVRLTACEVEKVRERQAAAWVPAIVSFQTPLRLKRAILRHVLAIDPHPIRSAMRPALIAARLKVRRHWARVRSA
jgi:glycosyltransferase involved in cell wall biosynthesis